MRRWAGLSEDSGAMTVIMAVVVTVLLVPLASYGLRTYVKNGLAGEAQRSADAGAVAGAASVPLADPTVLTQTYAQFGPNVDASQLIPAAYCPSTSCPQTAAYQSCHTELTTDDALAAQYAFPNGGYDCTITGPTNGALAGDLTSCAQGLSGTGGISAPVSALQLALQAGITELQAEQAAVAAISPTVAAQLGKEVAGMQSELNGFPQPLVSQLESLLPGLLSPSMSATAHYDNEQEPFTLGSSTGAYMQRTATATRHFKNVVVIPTLGLPGTQPGTQNQLDLNPVVAATEQSFLTQLDAAMAMTFNQLLSSMLIPVAGAVLPPAQQLPGTAGTTTPQQVLDSYGCGNIVNDLQGDLSDLIDPSNNPPSATQVVNQAVADNAPVLALYVPQNPTGATQIPFFDFVPVCLSQSGLAGSGITSVVEAPNQPFTTYQGFGSCTLAAPGLFRGRLSS